jgi:beta-N-acetylhexosaminidase
MRGRDQRVFRRRRTVAAAILVAPAVAICAGLDAALADGELGPDPAVLERRALDAVPERTLIGQKLMVRMEGTATRDLIRAARDGEIGGVILFPPADQPPGELRDQISRLQEAAREGGRPELLVSIDQEGGEVKRLPDGPPDRSPPELSAPGDEGAARRAGRETGRYLARLGVNVDLAPVLDVPSSSLSFVSSRAFGTDPKVVAANGVAFAEGLGEAGVVPAAKHFPGLGRAVANTDFGPSEVDAPQGNLDIDLAPFREAIARRIPMVMVGHATYTALDRDNLAALSETIVGGLLRRELGFDGVVISDDLGAGAIQAVASEQEAAVAAARAGIDVLLYAGTSDASPATSALREALSKGGLHRAALERSLLRIGRLKDSL